MVILKLFNLLFFFLIFVITMLRVGYMPLLNGSSGQSLLVYVKKLSYSILMIGSMMSAAGSKGAPKKTF